MALIVAVLLWPAAPPSSAARPPLYLMAIGNRLLETPDERHMPFLNFDVVYVPYFLFNNFNDIGVRAMWHSSVNELTINTMRISLEYNIHNHTVVDQTGAYRWTLVLMRHGIPFVDLDFVCSHFNLSWSPLGTGQVNILRVTARRADDLSDAQFLTRFRNTANAQAYLYHNPPVEPTPTPVFCLAITGIGENTAAMLDVLEEHGALATFFIEPNAIPGHSELIWRILGGGHGIGFLAKSSEDVQAGNALLSRTAFQTTRLIWVEEEHSLDGYRDRLVLWETAARGAALAGSVLYQAVEGGDPVPLRFDESESGHLARVLQQLVYAECIAVPLDERIQPAS
jgi:hypothetical protein